MTQSSDSLSSDDSRSKEGSSRDESDVHVVRMVTDLNTQLLVDDSASGRKSRIDNSFERDSREGAIFEVCSSPRDKEFKSPNEAEERTYWQELPKESLAQALVQSVVTLDRESSSIPVGDFQRRNKPPVFTKPIGLLKKNNSLPPGTEQYASEKELVDLMYEFRTQWIAKQPYEADLDVVLDAGLDAGLPNILTPRLNHNGSKALKESNSLRVQASKPPDENYKSILQKARESLDVIPEQEDQRSLEIEADNYEIEEIPLGNPVPIEEVIAASDFPSARSSSESSSYSSVGEIDPETVINVATSFFQITTKPQFEQISFTWKINHFAAMRELARTSSLCTEGQGLISSSLRDQVGNKWWMRLYPYDMGNVSVFIHTDRSRCSDVHFKAQFSAHDSSLRTIAATEMEPLRKFAKCSSDGDQSFGFTDFLADREFIKEKFRNNLPLIIKCQVYVVVGPTTTAST